MGINGMNLAVSYYVLLWLSCYQSNSKENQMIITQYKAGLLKQLESLKQSYNGTPIFHRESLERRIKDIENELK